MTEMREGNQGPSGEWPTPPPRPSTGPHVIPPIAAAEAEPRPWPVSISFWSWLTACLVAVVTAALTLVEFDLMHAEMLDLARQQDPTVDEGTLEQVATAAVAVLVGAGVLLALLQLGAASLMCIGRRWARVALILLAAVSILYGLLLFGGVPETALGSVFTLARVGILVHIGLVVGATVMMFQPGARSWFERPRPADSYDYG